MNPIPDWAPNIHPLLVHFPIALLYAAIAVDLVGCACWCNKPLRQAATLLYGLGAVGAIAAYLTGHAASQTVWLPGMAEPVLKEHWDWAWRTVWFFPIVTVVRTHPLRLRLAVPERVAAEVRIGQLVSVKVEGDRAVYRGQVARLSPAIRLLR